MRDRIWVGDHVKVRLMVRIRDIASVILVRFSGVDLRRDLKTCPHQRRLTTEMSPPIFRLKRKNSASCGTQRVKFPTSVPPPK